MRILKMFIILMAGLVLIWNCSGKVTKKENSLTDKTTADLPENLWISESFHQILDSTVTFYRQAQIKLKDGDTLGAEIYFGQAFEILSQLSDEEKETLNFYPKYDSLFRAMNEQYEEIYATSNQPMEAEEIREDIMEFEEQLDIPDSILFGEGTVIDTSCGIPITINEKVRRAIHYFQTRGRFVFAKWLERSGKYERIIRLVLREKNLPDELMYVAMIESGLNPNAQSYARAVGMWQFMAGTGRMYGLRQDWWFDERRDVFKATNAAAEHLQDLHERFGDWYLALSGYNCNPKKVEKNMKRYNTRNFWQLSKLPRQTRNYTPTFLAATIIAKNPKKFGFFVEKEPPLEVDSVHVSESVDLNIIAQLVDTSFTYIKEINPAVLRWVTPPGIKNFVLYLPKGARDKFKQGYANIPEDQKRSYVRHRVRQGESLSGIARKYHTSPEVIRSHNQINGNSIRASRDLLIPVPQNQAQYFAKYTEPVVEKKSKRARVIENVPGSKKVIYRVKQGDTLGEVAELYSARASDIRAWNNLYYGQHIYPNQDLIVWVPEKMEDISNKVAQKVKIDEDTGGYYTVKTGDTLWDISRKYGISVQELKKLNKMRTSQIRPGDRIKVNKN